MPFVSHTRNNGFTLAEVLIALALLGVIAAFAIPKVLQNSADAHKRAVFKETYSALSEVFYKGVLSGELNDTNQVSYLQTHLNALQTCDDSAVDGCYTEVISGLGSPGWINQPGVLLSNGSYLFIWGVPQSDKIRAMCVDYNGMQGPNLAREDISCFISCQQANTPNWAASGLDYCKSGAVVSHYGAYIAFNMKYAMSP